MKSVVGKLLKINILDQCQLILEWYRLENIRGLCVIIRLIAEYIEEECWDVVEQLAVGELVSGSSSLSLVGSWDEWPLLG